MRQLGYSDKLAASAIAAGGTLGILIPPSTIMVIYGIMTETNIGRLFAAGVLPGILAAFLLCLAVRYVIWREPESGPAGERSSWAARWRALRGVWGVVALFALSIGGIYAGIFTATEGAGIGAFGAFVFALARRSLSWAVLRDVLLESARTTSMLFMILIGALVFANFINFTTMPRDLQHFVERFAVHPTMVVAAMCAIYVILGTAMEELSMILLTVPVFFPVDREPRPRSRLVRDPDRGRGRDRPDQPAGRHEPVRHQRAPAARADPHAVPRGHAVRGGRRGAARRS